MGDEIRVVGELDAHTTPVLEAAVRSAPVGDRHIDATGVTFVGSSALTLLVELDDEARRAGGRLSIRASEPLRRLAKLTGLDHVLPLV